MKRKLFALLISFTSSSAIYSYEQIPEPVCRLGVSAVEVFCLNSDHKVCHIKDTYEAQLILDAACEGDQSRVKRRKKVKSFVKVRMTPPDIQKGDLCTLKDKVFSTGIHHPEAPLNLLERYSLDKDAVVKIIGPAERESHAFFRYKVEVVSLPEKRYTYLDTQVGEIGYLSNNQLENCQ